ncbi:hypothetical protein AB1Y20_023142 [Prymnesium parvum]|uniref:Ion transport domain-containing protein n=1 Tax=Prymnesium parvum TaxID=97485 RepID=A0AB34JFV1_PRYPA
MVCSVSLQSRIDYLLRSREIGSFGSFKTSSRRSSSPQVLATPDAAAWKQATTGGGSEEFLHLARQGELPAIRAFLDTLDEDNRRRCLTAVDPNGDTALFLAIQYEYPNVVALLLQDKWTNPMQKNHKGQNGLNLAARSNRPFVIRTLLHRLLAVEKLQRGELVTFRHLAQILQAKRGQPSIRFALARSVLVDVYSKLGVDELARCVVNDFKRHPASCLYDCVSLAGAIRVHARAARSLDHVRADDLDATSARLQLAAAGCLSELYTLKDGLGRYEVDELLLTPLGEAAIKLAVRHSCTSLLAQPPVQAFLTREWRGPLLQSVIDNADSDLSRLTVGIIMWVFVALLNLLFLPFLAAMPHLERRSVSLLKQYAAEEVLARIGMQVEDTRRSRASYLNLSQRSTPEGSKRQSSRGSKRTSAAESSCEQPSHLPKRLINLRTPLRGVECRPISRKGPPLSSLFGRLRRRARRNASSDTPATPRVSPPTSPVCSPPKIYLSRTLRAPPPVEVPASPDCSPPPHFELPSSPPPSPAFSALQPSEVGSPAAASPSAPGSPQSWSLHEHPARQPMLEFYLLRVPMFKFALRICSDVLLAWLVTFVRFEGTLPHLLIYFVWPASGLMSEYKQLVAADGSLRNEMLSWLRADTPSTYRADLFNTVDMLALHLLLFSTIAWYYSSAVHAALRAFAVLALCVRLLRLIYLSQSLGALVLLLVRMTSDMIKLFALLSFVLVALVSSLYVLHDRPDEDLQPLPLECVDFLKLRGSWSTWHGVMFILINSILDGGAQDALLLCSLHDNELWSLAWVFTYLFLLFVCVLLLNMMIAMFTRSFDVVFDSMIEHVQTNYARAVVAWCASPPEPPPLNLLRLPADFGDSLLAALFGRKKPSLKDKSMSYRRHSHSSFFSGLKRNAVAYSSLNVSGNTFSGLGLQPQLDEILTAELSFRSAAKKMDSVFKDIADYSGTTVKSVVGRRNSWDIWKEKDTDELVRGVAMFVVRHEDSLVQEERWRLKMLRRVGGQFNHVNARFDEVETSMDKRHKIVLEQLAELKQFHVERRNSALKQQQSTSTAT